MARQVGNDGDINRLNETTHYAGAANFKVSFVMVEKFNDVAIVRVVMKIWDVGIWLLGSKPPVAAQQAAQKKESFTLKLVWLWDRVRQMPQTDDPETLRQYARCYIMLLIGGYLIIDKSNNMVHLRWLPLLRDFAKCRAFFWGSAVLAWTYQSLSLAAQRGVTLVGLLQQSRDQHEAKVLRWRVSLDWLWFDEFAWRVCNDPARQALCPPWFCEEEEWGTWLSAVLYCASISSVFTTLIGRNGSSMESSRYQALRYLTTTGRGEDVWWPLKLKECYDRWHQRFEPGRRITVHHTFDTRPTLEYYDWWRAACRVRHLSGQEILEDQRLVELSLNVQSTTSQPRDDLALPRGVPDQHRRAREGRDDTRRPARRERGHRERQPGEPVRRERAHPCGWGSELSLMRRRTDSTGIG
ncbi:hypothetical protein Ahy_B08g089659 [Arachis hypogaea]|uniref:Aminotransferase-like plant mobile domain-containing protein n=1 Tax=Arachis hypogaea TaxID=3818 RepID=A0A444XYJ9_ARAHY|nr:hypothetical protein Ahy_B08g089659 [Arachis hypogaea]